jgi:hypothetical protein
MLVAALSQRMRIEGAELVGLPVKTNTRVRSVVAPRLACPEASS